MSHEQKKAIARRWFAQGWGKGDLTVADEIFAPDFTLNGVKVGPEGPKKNVRLTRTAFEDVTVTIEEQIAEGDTVVTRYRAHGTHRGEFGNVPASGKTVDVPGIVIWRIVDGKVVEDHTVFDQLTLLQQIGALPQQA